MMSNLYSAPLDTPLREQAEKDPFGTVTLWTYFNNALAEAARQVASSPPTEDDIKNVGKHDLVYASLLAFAKTGNAVLGNEAKAHFIKLLNRCVTSNPDIVDGAMTFMHEETGVSVLETPSMLQILLAVTIKHHNHHVLQKLAGHSPSGRGIFDFSSPIIASRLEQASATLAVWSALVAGGWIQKSEVPQNTESTNVPVPKEYSSPGNMLRSCAKDLPSKELQTYFPHIPRTLYTGISPYPKWPGDPVLVKYAAARTDPEGLKVLKLLVEIGGMDVNDSETWWKAGDHDPRAWNPKCADDSECSETALHIAVDKANLPVVEYLLTHGARSCEDVFGRTQLERAMFRELPEVIKLFQSHGWKPSVGNSFFRKMMGF